MDLNRTIAFRTGAYSLPLLLAAAISGCGGSSSGGPSGSAAPSVSLLAASPANFNRSGGAKGFDSSGQPVYAVRSDDGSKWTVYASKDRALYDIPVNLGPGQTDTGAVSGNFVVGQYHTSTGERGIMVGRKDAGAAARYPGYNFSQCSGGRALVYDDASNYFLMDLATGTAAAEPLPAGDLFIRDFKGRFVLCFERGSSDSSVYDVDSNSQVKLQPAAGTDGTVDALAVNSNGKVLGFTTKDGIAQLRVWNPAGVAGDVIDTSAPGGEFFLGWLSPDASRMAYKKTTASTERQFIRSGGVSYDVTAASNYTSLNGLSDDGTVGFAADLSAGESVATVAISYK